MVGSGACSTVLVARRGTRAQLRPVFPEHGFLTAAHLGTDAETPPTGLKEVLLLHDPLWQLPKGNCLGWVKRSWRLSEPKMPLRVSLRKAEILWGSEPPVA